MTDLTDIPEITNPDIADIIYTVSDPDGTPTPQKVTFNNIKNLFKNLIETLTGKTINVDDNSIVTGDTDPTKNMLKLIGGKFKADYIRTEDLGLISEFNPFGKIGGGMVNSLEFDTLNTIDTTQTIQTQIDSKGTGDGDALVASPLSQFTGIDVTDTQVNYLGGATSNIQTQIGANTTAIGANTTAIGANTTAIGANTTAIGANTADIGANTADIGANTADIGANTADIALKANSASPTLTTPTLNQPVLTYTLSDKDSDYTIINEDVGKITTMSAPSPRTITIPQGLMNRIGSSFFVTSIGVGIVTIDGGAGVTIHSTSETPTTPTLRTQYSSASIIQIGTNEYLVVGDIE